MESGRRHGESVGSRRVYVQVSGSVLVYQTPKAGKKSQQGEVREDREPQ